MTRTIAIANQKGGAGKTTTAINLASGLARKLPEKHVLLIDLDHQANTTSCFLGAMFAHGPRQPDKPIIYEVLKEEASITDALYDVELEAAGQYPAARFKLLPSHAQVVVLPGELMGLAGGQFRLYDALEPIRHAFDYIVMDCPPSLDLITVNALTAASEVIVPVDPGVYPLQGLRFLTQTIEQVRRRNSSLAISGVVATQTDRTNLAQQTRAELEKRFSAKVLPEIPRRVAIGEAHTHHTDIYGYDPDGDAACSYWRLVEEVINRG